MFSEHLVHFGILCGVVALLKNKTDGWSALWLSTPSGSSDDGGFRRFQSAYVRIFLLAMLADWTQGPYVYKLYASYGYDRELIARLFVVGFGTAGVFGVIIGGLADRFALAEKRKNRLIFFSSFFLLCCVVLCY